MAGGNADSLRWQIRMLVATEQTRRLTDRELLERFARERDEEAFAALVQRHGPMVLRVCRSVLGHEQDAEDSFQATFLVLARKAATLSWQESIAGWLYEAARRLAQEARAKTLQRRARENRADRQSSADLLEDISGRDLLEALGEELSQLSDKYRSPLVLCYLEGESGETATRRLGFSVSTLKRRLDKARQLLHARLERRGLALSGAGVATLLLHGVVSASVPPGLVQSTAQAAVYFAAGGTVASFSANALELTDAALAGLSFSKWKVATVVLSLCCILSGAGLWAHQAIVANDANARKDGERQALRSAEDAARDPPRTLEIPLVKEEPFDRDPGWEGFNNRILLARIPTVSQSFGYSPTNFAGKGKGEMGGRITRSTTPAYYADKPGVKTLNDKLTASGAFTLTSSSGNSAVFFGWFNAAQPGGGRPMNSLDLYLDGEKERHGKGARLAVWLVGHTNRTCGAHVTPYLPRQSSPTPIRTDGTRYTWALDYDPEANAGNGRFQFTIQSNPPPSLTAGEGRVREHWEGKTHTVDLPAGFKKEGAAFDRFGLMNLMTPGNAMTVYFDDLRYDGKAEDFARDPGWEGKGNNSTFQDSEQAGAHDFGFSAATNFAGGARGEIGGAFWRADPGYAFYADRIGPLTLQDRLEARGRVVLKVGAPQSDMYLGWFNSASRDRSPIEAGHFLGAHFGGPSRIGHYFRPAYTTAAGTRGEPKTGPILVPDRAREWTLIYDPTANNGEGAIHATLAEESVTLPLRKGRKAKEARFDRFGLFTSSRNGSLLKIYFDDLTYTARPGR